VRNYRDVPNKSLEATYCALPTTTVNVQEVKPQPRQTHFKHQTGHEDERFNVDHLPKMVIQLMPNVQDANMLAVHTEAVYFVRKMLLEIAQKQFPEYLSALNYTQVLLNIHQRSKNLDELFESYIAKAHGFNKGNAYNLQTHPESCVNVQITYKTFLE
jgi:hypothetical protein